MTVVRCLVPRNFHLVIYFNIHCSCCFSDFGETSIGDCQNFIYARKHQRVMLETDLESCRFYRLPYSRVVHTPKGLWHEFIRTQLRPGVLPSNCVPKNACSKRCDFFICKRSNVYAKDRFHCEQERVIGMVVLKKMN